MPVPARSKALVATHLVPVPMDQPVIVPNLETGAEVRQDVHAMRGRYCRLIVVVLGMMRRVDVFPVIEEVHSI